MVLLFVITSLILSLSYLFIISTYRYYWNQLPFFEPPPAFRPKTSVSVIVPARNEEKNIGECLASLAQLDYPSDLFEIIVVNDHSQDRTGAILRQFEGKNIKVLNLPDGKAGKKAALACGISNAGGELIVTTDADCKVPRLWLQYFAACYEKTEACFIAGPVVFEGEKNNFERFQSLDFMGMMLITGAGIRGRFMHSSNGANLAYPKEVYAELNGFDNISHIASGDDILFMQKVARKYPKRLFFLKNPEAAVSTSPLADVRSFVRQRIRWGAKSAQYPEWRITAILAVVFFYCWSIILSGGWLLLDVGCWMLDAFAIGSAEGDGGCCLPSLSLRQKGMLGGIFVGQVLIKSWVDYYFLRQASRFFGKEKMMRSFGVSQLLHIIYIAVVGLLANLRKRYVWKGRKVE